MRTTGLLIGLLLCCACGKLSTLRKPPTSVDVIESAWKSARYQEPRAEARRAVAKSDYVAAEAAFKRGLTLAEANQDWAVAARFSVNIVNTQLVRGLRAGVADVLQHATAVATRHHDTATISAAAITLANLHLAQNNWSAAEEQAREVLNSGVAISPKLRIALLASLSRSVGELRGPSAAMPTLQLCIEQAQAADADALLAKSKGSVSPAPIASTNQSLEAEFWDLAGHLYLLSKDWNRAEQALRRSYRLRLMAKDSRITWLYERFTRLAIGRRNWDEAARWLALANHSQRSLNSGVDWVLSVLDGQIAEGKGDTTHALHSYRTAWQQAKNWRRGAAAQEDALVNTEVQVQQAAEGFLRLAGRQLQVAKPQPGNRLVLEAFTIAEESRAWSMMLQAKGELSEPSAPAPGEAVILFALGNEISHRWDWTAKGLVWTPLPPKSVLQPLIKQAAQEIQEGLSGNAATTLHKLLLANAPRESHWRLVPDQDLFTMPFSALRNDQGQYLVESHDLAMVPSLRLARGKHVANNELSYLGAGDLIFNRADERWQTSAPSSGPTLVHAAESSSQELIRLAGSGAEVRALQRLYDKAHVPALTLEGPTANRARLESAIDGRHPAILHLATHATAVDGGRSIGLSLGISRTGEMEFWTPNRVASLKHVPSLVMLNACASGRAQALPGAGLLGMSRAWLMAGAQDVVLSSWALPDDNGEFARLFHQEFLSRYGEPDAAASALRAAQITCLRSPGFRSAPRFWAAYFLTSTHARTKTITRQ